jgi:hypothetical protein
MTEETRKIIIFLTQNNRLFEQLRNELKAIEAQKAPNFKAAKTIAKSGNIVSIVLHVVDENGWLIFDLVKKEFPTVPVYIVLAPAMSRKYTDLDALASERGAVGAVPYKNGVKALVAAIEPTSALQRVIVPHFDFVRLEFVKKMEWEIHENRQNGKGDWHGWKPGKLLLVAEINWHVAKLIGAIERGDAVKISEYAADVANYMMKADEVYGTDLPAGKKPEKKSADNKK